jgi:carotenoid cleavage dioxygenase-like enzyme
MESKRSEEWCTYNSVSPSGELSENFPVPLSRPQMMHDFAITANYAVFMDHALVFEPQEMVKRNTLPFIFDRKRPCRIGLLKRANPSEAVRWFDVEQPFACFHTANAWEDGDRVNLVVSWCVMSRLGSPHAALLISRACQPADSIEAT